MVISALSGKKVLVTGASGFIGHRLCAHLLETGCQLRTLQRKPGQHQAGVETCTGDLLDKDSLQRACQDIDVVFHLAAYAHINQHSQQVLEDTNITGTRNLAEAAIGANVSKLVFFSSILADSPHTAYGRSKAEAEKIVLKAAAQSSMSVCCLRPVNVYGPGMKGNLMTLIRLINRHLFPPLPVRGNRLAFVGVDDLCQAALLAATDSGADGNTYAVTDGQSYAMRDIEQGIRLALGQRVRKWSLPMWVLYIPALMMEGAGRVLRLKNLPGLRSYRALTEDNWVSSEAISRDLGYTPQSTFYTALPAIVQQEAGNHS